VSPKCSAIQKSGLARLAIQSFIFNASSGGHQETIDLLSSGGAQAATYLRMRLRLHTYVGVGKILIRDLSLVSLLILAIRPAASPELRGNAHTPVNYCAMQAHVLLVSIWGLLKLVFVARKPEQGDALIQTTTTAGVVGKSVAT
jgi:hypothetical protein